LQKSDNEFVSPFKSSLSNDLVTIVKVRVLSSLGAEMATNDLGAKLQFFSSKKSF
jgi:hypothetical protein